MNTLREAVQEYLNLRRSLGFKLREDGLRLLDFVAFMERRKASYITHELALAWAQKLHGGTFRAGATTGFRARFCTSSQRHRSTDGDSTRWRFAVPVQACPALHVFRP